MMVSTEAHATGERGSFAREVHRLSSLVNELTLRCVLNGVDLPSELCPRAERLPAPTYLDGHYERLVPWAQPAELRNVDVEGVQSMGYQLVLKSRQIPQSLQSLCLTDVSLPSATLRGILEQCSQLRSITLSTCTFHTNQFLMPATSLVNLTSMEIRNCQMSPKSAMETIAVALNLPQLHGLVLTDCCSATACMNCSTDEGHEVIMRDITAGSPCPMAVLDIGGLAAPGDAVQAVAKRCPMLLALGLRGSRAADATIAAIAAACPLLQALDLSLCPAVTSGSASQLLPLQHLRVLHLPPAAALVHFATLVAQLPALRILSGGGGTSQHPSRSAHAPTSPQRHQGAGTADGSCQTDLSVFHPHRVGGGCAAWTKTSSSPGTAGFFSAASSTPVLHNGSVAPRHYDTMGEATRGETGGSNGKLQAAGMPLGAPLRTGGWRMPAVSGTGAKLLRKVSKLAPPKPGLGDP